MNEATHRVADALQSGDLGPSDLTARKLGAWLGKTTSVLYHHWGSLDGFLHAVGQEGFVRLAERSLQAVDGVADGRDALERIALAWLDFALEAPQLYELMFHRAWDWEALKAHGDIADSPGLKSWHTLVQLVGHAGSSSPDTDARLFYGAVHGLCSLTLTGRANVGDLGQTDREAAERAIARLTHLIAGSKE